MTAHSPQLQMVTATRLSERQFSDSSALAHSLRRLGDPRIRLDVAFGNREALPDVYNRAIEHRSDARAFAFVHDDVWIDDYFFVERLFAGLGQFDVIGLAGSRQRRPRQKGWAFIDDPAVHDDIRFMSGRIALGPRPWGDIYYWGPVPAQCELLDGVLLGVAADTLRNTGLRFDSRFAFHFYDLDFCRRATELGLRLGTWPICVTHQSPGDFTSEAWGRSCEEYFRKWGE